MKKILIILSCISLIIFIGACSKTTTENDDVNKFFEQQAEKDKEDWSKTQKYNIEDEHDIIGDTGEIIDRDITHAPLDKFEVKPEDNPVKDPSVYELVIDEVEMEGKTSIIVTDDGTERKDYQLLGLDEYLYLEDWIDKNGQTLTAYFTKYKDKNGRIRKRYLYSKNSSGNIVYDRSHNFIEWPGIEIPDTVISEILDNGDYVLQTEVEKGSGVYIYNYYTPEGRSYRIVDSGGNLRYGSTYDSKIFDNIEYITRLDNTELKEFIKVMPGQDFQAAYEDYVHGKAVLVNRDIAIASGIIKKDETTNSKLIDKYISGNDYYKKSYELAQNYSSLPDSSDPNVQALSSLIGSNGYFDIGDTKYQTSSEKNDIPDALREDLQRYKDNPSVMEAFKQTEMNQYVSIKDALFVIHLMTYSDAEKFLKEMFDETYAEIQECERVYDATKLLNTFNTVAVVSGRNEYVKDLRSQLQTYRSTLKNKINDMRKEAE